MSKRSRSRANIPIHRESLFWILSPIFCLNRPSCPACHEFMSQLCKTKPISSRPKTMQPPLPQTVTPIFRSAALEKTNPIKPNSPAPAHNPTITSCPAHLLHLSFSSASALHLSRLLYKSPLFLQNKPNFKMGNINISAARTKAYANEQRTINNEHYPKQSQSNPIWVAAGPVILLFSCWRRWFSSIWRNPERSRPLPLRYLWCIGLRGRVLQSPGP